MECPICYTNAPSYVINCGSTVEHKVCDECEITMRMKEPATRDGRILKCPMCRVPEKAPGKRTAFSYEYELSKLYETAPRPERVSRQENLAELAYQLRGLPRELQDVYTPLYPEVATYMEAFNDPQTRRLPFGAQVSPLSLYTMRPPADDYHAFCQSGKRELGTCPTRGKTERKCTHPGCGKFVCRSCRMCLTH
jgi:hypothetical protein